MTPGNYDLCIYRGDTGRWRFVCWQDAEKTMPSDFTGATAAAQIRDRPGGNQITQLYCGVIAPNTVDVAVLAADSALLPPRGVWDLQLTYESSDVRTLVAGKVLVTGDVTQAAVPAGVAAPAPAGPVRVVHPASGETIVMGAEVALHVATGPLAALTVRLPPGPALGVLIEVSFALPITALTIEDAAGFPVAGAPDSGYGPGAALELRYLEGPPGIGLGSVEMTDTVAIDIVAQPTPVIEVIAGVGQQGPPGPAWQPGFTSVDASGTLPSGTNGLVLVDSTAGPRTVTLPPAPSLGQTLTVKDSTGHAGANHVTVAGGGFTIEGALTLVIGSNYGWVQLAFTGTSWVQV